MTDTPNDSESEQSPTGGKTVEDLERDEQEFNIPNENTALETEGSEGESDSNA